MDALVAVVLDPFGGSGSTLIAAEPTGHKARLIEIHARYADTIVRRWQDLTSKEAVDAASGQTSAFLRCHDRVARHNFAGLGAPSIRRSAWPRDRSQRAGP